MNTRRLSLLLTLLMAVATSRAVRATGEWLSARLADGTSLQLRAVGDEWLHYFEDAAGLTYQLQPDGTVSPAAVDARRARSRRQETDLRRARRLQTRRDALGGTVRRGLVILVSFADVDFKFPDPKGTWSRIANERGYSENGARGSIHDYFYDQSLGRLDLEFDVVGPVRMDYGYAHYGKNDSYGDDANVGELIRDACLAVGDSVDFAAYDWDDDGEVDQVYVLYAGYGENARSLQPDLIWPHEWEMQEWEGIGRVLVGDRYVNTYACGSELNASGRLDGMGTFCHEFAHCLGLPDMYNTDSGRSVLGSWDVMDSGCYNDGGWCPAGFSAYERYFCGWLEPVVLTEPTTVEGLAPVGDGGQAYMVVNDSPDAGVEEYYLLDNRQPTGWDASLPGSGLLIAHIDYDRDTWDDNAPNNLSSHYRAYNIPANGGSLSGSGVAYPYTNPRSGAVNDSLTDRSTPAATVYHANAQGSFTMGKPITAIRVDGGLASFCFCGGATVAVASPRRPVADGRSASYRLDGTLLGQRSSAVGPVRIVGRRKVVSR